MLYLAYLGEDKKLDLPEGTLKLLIVRNPPEEIPLGFKWVPHLSPSPTLFQTVHARWKKGIYTQEEQDYIRQHPHEEKEWWNLYLHVFEKEMEERPDMAKAFKRLEEVLQEGKDVYLYCYCKDPHLCHRGSVGKRMQQLGYEVDFRIPFDPYEQLDFNL